MKLAFKLHFNYLLRELNKKCSTSREGRHFQHEGNNNETSAASALERKRLESNFKTFRTFKDARNFHFLSSKKRHFNANSRKRFLSSRENKKERVKGRITN